MAISQNDRVATVTTPLGEDVLALWRMTGNEHLSRLFEYELELLSERNDIDLTKLLGKDMTVKLNLLEGGERPINGMVTKISQIGMLGRYYCYRATLRPKPWLLTRKSNCRIMPAQMTAPDIVKKILEEHGFTDVKAKLSHQYRKREYCVQYRETDFNFISRLMEDEGIYYYFDHTDKAHTMVLCDTMSKHDKVPGDSTIVYYPRSNQTAYLEGHIYDWNLSREMQSGVYELDDFDFEAPNADLTFKSSNPGKHAEANKALYDYPGGYTNLEKSDGEYYAKVRLEESRALYEQTFAQGNARQLATGRTFTLAEFPRQDQNCDHLIVSLQFQIQNNGYSSDGIGDTSEPFQCSCAVLRTKENQYRPPRSTLIPIVQGVQTAIVVGKSGEEIFTDKYGRIKVQFHWDREGKKDENSSCWVRVAQVWAGKNWGAIHIPRVGQEVIVDFLEGNPDRPIVTGAVYNADQMPPYELEANKTQSGIKSRSSKGAGAENFNEIRFEDKKGEEELYIHAEKNLTRIVENNDVLKVGFDKKDQGNQTIDIYNDRTVTLENGHDTLTVKKGNRITNVDTGNNELTVKTGNRSASIDTGNDSVNIKTGNRTVQVDLGSIQEEAMQSIELKVGQNSITIDQKGITLKGIMITIEGQAKTDLKSPMTTVNGDGMLTMKGGIVMIN
ncbi:MAG: type VI secretion system Vgr family protein [Methylomicrobium sp.]